MKLLPQTIVQKLPHLYYLWHVAITMHFWNDISSDTGIFQLFATCRSLSRPSVGTEYKLWNVCRTIVQMFNYRIKAEHCTAVCHSDAGGICIRLSYREDYIYPMQKMPVTKTKHSGTVISVPPSGCINVNAIVAGEKSAGEQYKC